MIWKKEKQKQKKFANLLVLLESGYGLQQHIFPDCFRMKPEAITIHVEDQSEINDPEAGLIPKTSTEESGENGHQERKASAKKNEPPEEPEPCLITLFKWSLIVSGFIMLCFALYFLSEVIYSWYLKVNFPPKDDFSH